MVKSKYKLIFNYILSILCVWLLLVVIRDDASFNFIKVFSQTSGIPVMLFQGTPGCTTGVNCCPSGFTELTGFDGRLLLSRNDPVGAPTVGGGDGSHSHSGGGHTHPFNLGHKPCCGGGAAAPGGGDHSHTGGGHDHQWVGFRLCQWGLD